MISQIAPLVLALLQPAAQQPEEPRPEPKPHRKTIVVTATRWETDPFETPRALTIVDEQRIAERNPLSLADALNDRIGIWVEKRTSTTSDPVIRGLSGSNILALIDGNTLSTFWGEGGWAGDDMYGKVDADAIQRIEVIRGPGSVLYGTNALGGVINFITRDPAVPFPDHGTLWASRTKIGLGSAASEVRLRQEISLGMPAARFMLGVSWRDVDNVEGGGVGTMDPTEGEDMNGDIKAQFLLGGGGELILTAQNVRRDPVFRFYRPHQDNRNDRTGVGATLRIEEVGGWADEIEARVYHQDKEDTRNEYGTWPGGSFTPDPGRTVLARTGVARWKTWSAGFQARSTLGRGSRLSWGFAYERDDGESPDDEQFTWTHFSGPDAGSTLKDAPDSTWDSKALFLVHEWDLSPDVMLTTSVRTDWFRFDSDVDPLYLPPSPLQDPLLDDIEESEVEMSGGLALLWRASEEVHLTGSLFRGFRFWPPKFGATQHGEGIRVPGGTMPPVVGDTLEFGAKIRDPGVFEGSGFVYATRFDNHQMWVRGMFDGLPYFDWNDNGSWDSPTEDVWVLNADGRAYVYGVELEGTIHLDEEWSLRTGFAWNIGKDREADEPLRHTQPARFVLGLRWNDPDPERGGWFEAAADAVRHYDRIPSSRLSGDVGYKVDPQDGSSPLWRSDGLPGYSVYAVRAGVNLTRGVSLTAAVENLTDKHFRRAHSRWDETGRDVILGITITDQVFRSDTDR